MLKHSFLIEYFFLLYFSIITFYDFVKLLQVLSPISTNAHENWMYLKISLDKELTANCHIETRMKLGELILAAVVLKWPD